MSIKLINGELVPDLTGDRRYDWSTSEELQEKLKTLKGGITADETR